MKQWKVYIDPIALDSRSYEEYVCKKRFAGLRVELNQNSDFRKECIGTRI